MNKVTVPDDACGKDVDAFLTQKIEPGVYVGEEREVFESDVVSATRLPLSNLCVLRA